MQNSLPDSTRFDRLFVPLSKEPFGWFASGRKKWELRRVGNQFHTDHIYHGRLVELRLGYSTSQSLWGCVQSIIHARSLTELFSQVPYEDVIPMASTEEEAVDVCTSILDLCSDNPSLIAFKVSRQIEELEIDAKYVDAILKGEKVTTVRKGERQFKCGPAVLRTEDYALPVKISNVINTTIPHLTQSDAKRDGFDSLVQLENALSNHYPEIQNTDPVTIVEFITQVK